MKHKSRLFAGYILIIALIISFIALNPGVCFALSDVPVPDSEIGSLKKGTRIIGLSMTLKNNDSENPDSILPDILTVEQSRYKINAFGGYFIRDLFQIGGKWGYDYTKNEYSFLDSSKIRSQVVKEYNRIGFSIRNYLPIDNSGRFSLFVQTGLDFGYGKEVKQDTFENNIDRKVSKNYILEVGVTPGIMAFINKGVAIEASVNVLGLSTKWGKYDLNNGELTGHHSSTDLDFTVDLLSLFLGITYHF